MPHLNQRSLSSQIFVSGFLRERCALQAKFDYVNRCYDPKSRTALSFNQSMVHTYVTACFNENGSSETEIYIIKFVLSLYGTLVPKRFHLSCGFVDSKVVKKICEYCIESFSTVSSKIVNGGAQVLYGQCDTQRG